MAISDTAARQIERWTLLVGGVEMVLGVGMSAFPTIFPTWLYAVTGGIGLATIGVALILMWNDLPEHPKAVFRKWIGPIFLFSGVALIAGIVGLYLYHSASVLFAEGSSFGVILTTAILLLLFVFLFGGSARRSGKSELATIDSQLVSINDDIQKRFTAQSQVNRSLDGMIGGIDDKVDKLAEQLEARASTLGVMFKELKEETKRSYELTGLGQLRLATAMRARNAQEIIKQHDARVIDLARLLISAEGCETQDWLTKYREWKDVVGLIDMVVGEWKKKEHQRFLEVSASEIERVRDLPPSNLDRDRTATQFKTLCLVNERYQDSRSGILDYFAQKVADI